MITEIGIVAGEIWQYLDKYNEATLTQIVEATKREKDLVIMGIGWLAREGHVSLTKIENDYKVVLRR